MGWRWRDGELRVEFSRFLPFRVRRARAHAASLEGRAAPRIPRRRTAARIGFDSAREVLGLDGRARQGTVECPGSRRGGAFKTRSHRFRSLPLQALRRRTRGARREAMDESRTERIVRESSEGAGCPGMGKGTPDLERPWRLESETDNYNFKGPGNPFRVAPRGPAPHPSGEPPSCFWERREAKTRARRAPVGFTAWIGAGAGDPRRGPRQAWKVLRSRVPPPGPPRPRPPDPAARQPPARRPPGRRAGAARACVAG